MIPKMREWSPQDSVAGELCLKFTNAVGDRTKTRDVDWLTDWEALLEWAVATSALKATEAQDFRKIARRNPAASKRSLQSMLNFRKVLFSVLSALAAGHAPALEDLERLEIAVLGALRVAQLTQKNRIYSWAIRPSKTSMKTPLTRIALSALQLMQGDDLSRLREC